MNADTSFILIRTIYIPNYRKSSGAIQNDYFLSLMLGEKDEKNKDKLKRRNYIVSPFIMLRRIVSTTKRLTYAIMIFLASREQQ